MVTIGEEIEKFKQEYNIGNEDKKHLLITKAAYESDKWTKIFDVLMDEREKNLDEQGKFEE